MRRLSLHASALNDAEYDLYTSSLNDLAESNTNNESNKSYDDLYYESLKVGIREARAWFRGRYSHVLVSDIDSILRLFHSNLAQSDALTGGQFFAALRLVIHAEGGEGIDRSLAFVQAHPHSRPLTPSRHSHQPPLSPPPVPRNSQNPSRALSAGQNPFSRHLSDAGAGPQDDTSSYPITVAPQLNTQFHSSKTTHNPFLMRNKATDGSKLNVNADIRTPPLPPRKPAPAPPPVPPPRHASLILNTPSKLTPPVIPSSSTSVRTTHITSTLMSQSLRASEVARTMRKAEKEREQKIVPQVLQTASSSRVRSTSPSKTNPDGFVVVSATTASSSGSDEAGRVPPLPARRTSKSNPSSSSSAGSRKSLEQVASASIMHSRSPFRSVLPDRELTGSPFSESPNRSSTDIPTSTSVPLLVPPTHPDRKPTTEASTPTAPESPASQTPRVFRSKSLHHPSPPPPPLPRRRPGSVQLTPYATPESSPFFTSPNQQLPESRSEPSALPGLSRHLSLSSRTRNGSRSRDQSNATNAPESPMANLQRTLTSLQLKAQPKLDAARYKAEAGLSRRGYVHHSHRSPWVEEGEEGLMVADVESEDGRPGVDPDYDKAFTDDEHSSEEERMRGRRIAAGWDKGHGDSLKWPAGEGWKPL